MPASGQSDHQSPRSALVDMLVPIAVGKLASAGVLLVCGFIRFA